MAVQPAMVWMDGGMDVKTLFSVTGGQLKCQIYKQEPSRKLFNFRLFLFFSLLFSCVCGRLCACVCVCFYFFIFLYVLFFVRCLFCLTLLRGFGRPFLGLLEGLVAVLLTVDRLCTNEIAE